MSTPAWGQPPQQQPVAPAPKKSGGCAKAGCLGVLAVVGVIGVAAAVIGGRQATSGSTTTSTTTTRTTVTSGSTAAKAAPETVTFVVTGASDADITYGPAGSATQGHAPMRITQPLDNPQYYSISAQLQGSGSVTCTLEIDGKPVSTASASGGYNIADCEVSKDPFSGAWTDTNKA